MIVGNYASYTKSDFYETVNVITNFLGQPLSIKCDFWVGLTCLWNGLNNEMRGLIYFWTTINAKIPLYTFPSLSTPEW